jgi:hypothetical protein
MKRNAYYPIRQSDQIVWLANFANKLPSVAAALGLPAATVTAAVADCNWLSYVLQTWLPAVRTWAQSGTDAANDAQIGDGTAAMTLPVFTPPPLPTGVTAVNPGALDRIFDLVQTIKDNNNCTDAISTNLGIIGSAQSGPDLTTIQPALDASIVGNNVLVKWGWGGNSAYLDMCEIQVDRGDGKGFVLLTYDTTPNYTDTQPLPATPAVWKYKAIYRVDEAQVGNWSGVISVPVAG